MKYGKKTEARLKFYENILARMIVGHEAKAEHFVRYEDLSGRDKARADGFQTALQFFLQDVRGLDETQAERKTTEMVAAMKEQVAAEEAERNKASA